MYESWRVMGYQDGYRLLVIVGDYVLSTACTALEFAEFPVFGYW